MSQSVYRWGLLCFLVSNLLWFADPLLAENGPKKTTDLSDQKPEQKKLFRWKFDKNKTYHWVTTESVVLNVTGLDKEVNVNMSMTLDFDIQVLKQDLKNDITVLKLTLTRIRCTGKTPVANFVTDTSEKIVDTELNFMKRFVAENHSKMLLGLEIEFQINARGIIKNVKVDEDRKRRIQFFFKSEAPGTLLEARGLNSLYFGGFIPFPKSPIKVGDYWTQPYTTGENEFGSFVLKFSPHYMGEIKINDQSLDKFDLKVDMEQGKTSLIPYKFGKQSSEGALYFDPKNNIVQRCAWKIDSRLIFENGKCEFHIVREGHSRFGLQSDFKEND